MVNRRRWGGAVVCVIAVTVAAAFAQRYVEGGRALDANLRVDSGGYNPATGQKNFIQRDIYRVNRATGEFEYDEWNAFAQPAYRVAGGRQKGVNDPLNSAYRRPTVPTTYGGAPYVIDRSTGTFRYDYGNAFAKPQYRPGSQPATYDTLSVAAQSGRGTGAVRPATGSTPPPAAARRASLRVEDGSALRREKYRPTRGGGGSESLGYRPGR